MSSKGKRARYADDVTSTSTSGGRAELHHTKRRSLRLRSKRERAAQPRKGDSSSQQPNNNDVSYSTIPGGHPTDSDSSSENQTLATALQTFFTPSLQQTVNNDGVTSTAPTSNPNLEISDNHQSSTINMQAMSVSSSLPSSNAFSITTSTNTLSGVTTNGIASVSSTSSMLLQPSSVSESDQMGTRSTMAGGSTVGVGGASGTGLTNPQSDMTSSMGGSMRSNMEQQMQPMQPMQGTQSWHQDVSPDLRQHLIWKLVTTIYPVQDQNALQDRRVMSLIQYARKVEKSMFEVAQSKDQYYEMLTDKIYKIQKELEERRNRLVMSGQWPNRGKHLSQVSQQSTTTSSTCEILAQDNLESTSQSLQGSSAHTQLKRVTRTTGLKIPTMNKLNRWIPKMAPYYYSIGLELDILNSQLKNIKTDSSFCGNEEKCREMLDVWLANDTSATWEKLCKALESIEQRVLARDIGISEK